jgi:hypothetical protein
MECSASYPGLMRETVTMDLPGRCRVLLERIADRVPPDVLAEARSYGDDGEWEAALILIGNTGVYFGREEEDLLNELLSELAGPPPEHGPLQRRREFLVHPSHFQYWLVDEDFDYYPEVAPLEKDELISVDADRHMINVTTGMNGFDLPLTVEILDAMPALDLGAWEEVSEATADLTGPVLYIAQIEMSQSEEFPLPAEPEQTRSYRFRVHANGRAGAREAGLISVDEGDALLESHLIQVWPAPLEPLKTWKAGGLADGV